MRPAALLLTLLLSPLLACDSGDGETDASTTDTPTTTTTTSPTTTAPTTGTDSPTGEPCPLLGFYSECGADGRAYCDEIAGMLQFGPCLTQLACNITDPEDCFSRCELVDGVPTKIPQDICSTSGI